MPPERTVLNFNKMTEKKNKEEKIVLASANPNQSVVLQKPENPPVERDFPRGKLARGSRRGDRKGRERERSEFDSRTIDVRRVARVVAGGRRFNFSVAIIVGDHRGSVGVGLGKGADTALAIDKATRAAKKNMVKAALTKTMSISHETQAKYGSAIIKIIPAPGRGLIAGSSARIVFELCGVKDMGSKILSGSKNKLNIARAAVKALSQVKPPKSI